MWSFEATRGATILCLLALFCLILLYDNELQLTLVLVRSLHSKKTTHKFAQSSVSAFQTNKEPLILLYNKWSSSVAWGTKFGKIGHTSMMHLKNCSSRCRFTVDRRHYEDSADLVVVGTFFINRDRSLRNINATVILKRENETGQLWAGVSIESPHYQEDRGKQLDSVFHWIGTYRRNADIFWPYGNYKALNTTHFQNQAIHQNRGKKKLVAWLVSRCKTQSKREILVKTLKRYIPVDIYGRCGRKCPGNCREYLAANYKFYLSFENSLCMDYVTEKLFFMLATTTDAFVPVTYSWINDTRLAPPRSYINALDFKSVKDLAEYLKFLDRNDTEYGRYLEWKKHFEILPDYNHDALCRTCAVLLNASDLSPGRKPTTARLRRYKSLLDRYNSFSDRDGNRTLSYFKIGRSLIPSNKICIDPDSNIQIKDWLLGKS